MFDKRNLHSRLQEMCDCFVTADLLAEMSRLDVSPDKEEAALKWLALTILHGIDSRAEKITIHRTKDGRIAVKAKYQKSALPSPGTEIGRQVFESVRQITHMEEGRKVKTPLAVGFMDSSLEIKLKAEKDGEREKVAFKFPKLKHAA